MDAARERAQLVERADDLGVGLGEELVDCGAAVGEPAAGELEREPDPEQALLGAVVEVALEPPPLGVAGLDDARARGAHLGELGAQLGLQARVLQREARRGADRLDELGVVEQRRVVDERGEALAVVLEHRDRSARLVVEVERVLRRRRRSARPSGSQKASSSDGSPSVRAIASRTCAGRGSEPSSTTRSATRGAVQPRAQQTDQEGERQIAARRRRQADSRTEPSGVSRSDSASDRAAPRKSTSAPLPEHGGERAAGRPRSPCASDVSRTTATTNRTASDDVGRTSSMASATTAIVVRRAAGCGASPGERIVGAAGRAATPSAATSEDVGVDDATTTRSNARREPAARERDEQVHGDGEEQAVE